MRGVFLTFVSSSEGQRKLIPRFEEHVIVTQLGEHDVMIQVKACGLSRVDSKTLSTLLPQAEEFPVGTEVSGIVVKVGSAVQSFAPNDEVCGILALDSELPGCAEFCVAPEYCLVRKYSKVSHVDCAAVLRPGVRAHTALFSLSDIDSKSTVAVFSAASADGFAIIQLCNILGTKVIAIVNNQEEAAIVSQFYPHLYKIIDMSAVQDFIETCLHETGGLGVNCVIDAGVSPGYSLSEFIIESPFVLQQLKQEANRYESETEKPSSPPLFPSKHQIISILAAQGHWVTSQPDLQLEPPESHSLFLKGASLHFLFDPVWTLSSSQQGKYLHILQSIMDKLKDGTLRPLVFKTVALQQVPEELTRLAANPAGKLVMSADIDLITF